MWPDVRPCVTCVRVHDRSRPYVATLGPTASRVAVIAQELKHKTRPRSRRGTPEVPSRRQRRPGSRAVSGVTCVRDRVCAKSNYQFCA